MYKIIRSNRRFNNKLFESYEEARQYIRKWLRKEFGITGHGNLADHNFSIKQH